MSTRTLVVVALVSAALWIAFVTTFIVIVTVNWPPETKQVTIERSTTPTPSCDTIYMAELERGR